MNNGKDDPGHGSSGAAFRAYTAKDAKVESTEKPAPPGPGVQKAALDAWAPTSQNKPEQIQSATASPEAKNSTQSAAPTDAAAAKSPNASVAATEGAALTRGTVSNPSESAQDKAMAQQIESKNLSVSAETNTPTTHRPNSASDLTQSASASGAKAHAPEGEKTPANQDRPQPMQSKELASTGTDADKKIGVAGSDDQSKNAPKTPVAPTEASESKNKVEPPPSAAEVKNDASAANRLQDPTKEAGRDTAKPGLSEPGKDVSTREAISKTEADKTAGKDSDPRGHSQQMDKQSEIAGGRLSSQTEKSPIADGKPDPKSLDGKAGAKAEAELLTLMDRHTVFDSTKGGRIPAGKSERTTETPGDRAGTKTDATGQRTDGTPRSPDARGDVQGNRPGDVKDPGQRSGDWNSAPGGKIEVQLQGDVKIRLPHKDGQPELNLSDKGIQRDLSNGFGLIDKQQFREFVTQHKQLVDFVTELPRRSFEALKDIVSNITEAPKTTQLREWAQDLANTKEQPKTLLDRLHHITIDNIQFWKRHEDLLEKHNQSKEENKDLFRRGEEAYQTVKELLLKPITELLLALSKKTDDTTKDMAWADASSYVIDKVLRPAASTAQQESNKSEQTTPSEPSVAQSPQSYQTIVTTGEDTVNSLSEKCCGDIRCASLLMKLNPDLPDDRFRPLQKGLVLKLPTFDEIDAFKKHVLGAEVL